VLNALARLGWSLDDKTEIMSLETVVANFTLNRVVKSPAGLDPDKLLSFQSHWMGQLPLDAKTDSCLPYLAQAGLMEYPPTTERREYLGRVIEVLGERLRLFSDVLEYREFFVADDALVYDEGAFEKRVRKEGAAALLERFKDCLGNVESFDAPSLERATQRFVESEGIKLGDLIHAVRVAVSGKTTGPGMFETLALLGRERSVARIDRALQGV
jgi:glutamyl-tRNA synthetase